MNQRNLIIFSFIFFGCFCCERVNTSSERRGGAGRTQLRKYTGECVPCTNTERERERKREGERRRFSIENYPFIIHVCRGRFACCGYVLQLEWNEESVWYALHALSPNHSECNSDFVFSHFFLCVHRASSVVPFVRVFVYAPALQIYFEPLPQHIANIQ